MSWTTANLLLILSAFAVIWLFATLKYKFHSFNIKNVRSISLKDDLAATFLPFLTIIVATFSVGASNETSAKQAMMSNSMSTLQVQMADFRGELRFKATYDSKWTLVISKLDSTPFALKQLTLTPTFQRSASVGPETGAAVSFDPLTYYDETASRIVINSANEKACEKEQSATCQQTLEYIFIEFTFGGAPHRVVAYQID